MRYTNRHFTYLLTYLLTTSDLYGSVYVLTYLPDHVIVLQDVVHCDVVMSALMVTLLHFAASDIVFYCFLFSHRY